MLGVNRSGMLPGPAIAFALGFYDVTMQGGSLFDKGARDVFSAAGDRNSTSWPCFNSVSSLALFLLVLPLG